MESFAGAFTNAMGLAASPITAGGLLVLLIDQMEGSSVAAFDLRNGEVRWKVGRTEPDSRGTSLRYRRSGSKPLIAPELSALVSRYGGSGPEPAQR